MVIDPGELGQGLRDLDFSDLRTLDQLITHDEIVVNRFANVRDGFLLRGALRPTPGESGHGDTNTFGTARKRNLVFHVGTLRSPRYRGVRGLANEV